MSDPSQIREGMPVLANDGERVGTVDAVEGGERLKLKRNDSPDGQHHYVPLSSVVRVDDHVHLDQSAAAVRGGAGWGAGATSAAAGVGTAAASTGAAPQTHGEPQVDVERDDKDGTSWLPWLLGALALLALLIFGVRGCDNQERAVVAPPPGQTTTDAARTGTATTARTENIVLSGG